MVVGLLLFLGLRVRGVRVSRLGFIAPDRGHQKDA